VTEELLRRGLPNLAEIREGVAFFHLQTQQGQGEPGLGLRVVSAGSAAGREPAGSAGRVVAVPIENGELVLPPAKEAPRILLTRAAAAAGMDPSPSSYAAGPGDVSVSVTWNGEKVRAGSSHRCEVREAETSAPRKEALDKALLELGVDIQVRWKRLIV
jgi:hypothetical protein